MSRQDAAPGPNTPNPNNGAPSPNTLGYKDTPEPAILPNSKNVEEVRYYVNVALNEEDDEAMQRFGRYKVENFVLTDNDVQVRIRYDMEFRRNLFRDKKLLGTFRTDERFKNIFFIPRNERSERQLKCLVHLPMTQLYYSDLMFVLLKAAMDGLVIIYLAKQEPHPMFWQMEIDKITVDDPESNSKKKKYTRFRSVSGIPNELSNERFIDYRCPDFEKFGDYKDHVTELSFFMYMLEQTRVKFYARINADLKDKGETELWKYLTDEERHVRIPVVQDSFMRFNKVWQYDIHDEMYAKEDGQPKPLLSFTMYKQMENEENPVPPKYPSPPKYESLEPVEDKIIQNSPPAIESPETESPILNKEEVEDLKRGRSPDDIESVQKKIDFYEPPTSQHFVLRTSHVNR